MAEPPYADGPAEVEARGDKYIGVKDGWWNEFCDPNFVMPPWSDLTWYGNPPADFPWGDGMLTEHWEYYAPYDSTHDFRTISIYTHEPTGKLWWFATHIKREWLTQEASELFPTWLSNGVARNRNMLGQTKRISLTHRASNPAPERDFGYYREHFAIGTNSEAMAGRSWENDYPSYEMHEEELSPFGAPQRSVEIVNNNGAGNWATGGHGSAMSIQRSHNWTGTRTWYLFENNTNEVGYAVTYRSRIDSQTTACDFTNPVTTMTLFIPWENLNLIYPENVDGNGEFDWNSEFGRSIYTINYGFRPGDFFGLDAQFQLVSRGAGVLPFGNQHEELTPTPIYFSKHPYEVYEALDASNIHFPPGEVLSTRTAYPNEENWTWNGEYVSPYAEDIEITIGPDDPLKFAINATTNHLLDPPSPIAPYVWGGTGTGEQYFAFGSDVRTGWLYRGSHVRRRVFIDFIVCPEEECPPHLRLLQRTDPAKGPFENIPVTPDCGKALRLIGRDVHQNLTPGKGPRVQPNSYP